MKPETELVYYEVPAIVRNNLWEECNRILREREGRYPPSSGEGGAPPILRAPGVRAWRKDVRLLEVSQRAQVPLLWVRGEDRGVDRTRPIPGGAQDHVAPA